MKGSVNVRQSAAACGQKSVQVRFWRRHIQLLRLGAAALVGGGAFYYFKIYKVKASKPKKVVSEDDEDDEPEIEDPNDDVKSESDDE